MTSTNTVQFCTGEDGAYWHANFLYTSIRLKLNYNYNDNNNNSCMTKTLKQLK